jgi:gamma-glutamyl-gamma-aminobutyrate hydrolase PuuD
MTRPRIGLSQRADDVPGRGERRDALDQQWAARLEAARYVPVPIPNLLAGPATFVDELDLALLILTGGNDLDALPRAQNAAPERDRLERALLDAATARGLPVLGVCRGLQSMVHHGGGKLRRVEGHVARPHPIEVAANCGWPIRNGRVVNSFHDWAVTPDELGPDLVALAFAPDGTVEAARHRALPQVCVMWHPEREPEDADDLALIDALLGGR